MQKLSDEQLTAEILKRGKAYASRRKKRIALCCVTLCAALSAGIATAYLGGRSLQPSTVQNSEASSEAAEIENKAFPDVDMLTETQEEGSDALYYITFLASEQDSQETVPINPSAADRIVSLLTQQIGSDTAPTGSEPESDCYEEFYPEQFGVCIFIGGDLRYTVFFDRYTDHLSGRSFELSDGAFRELCGILQEENITIPIQDKEKSDFNE